MKLAVYGTLKRGYHNHDRYLKDSLYLGFCWVENYALADEGFYPFAFRFPNRKVLVEVYEVDVPTLDQTDRLEGVNSGHYSRDQVTTHWGQAFMYTQTGRVLTTGTDKWFPDGIWQGQQSWKVAWAGWQTEIRLAAQDEARRQRLDRTAEKDEKVYMPPPHRSGKTVKVWNNAADAWEYVPEEEADSLGLPRNRPGVAATIGDVIVKVEPKPLTKMELARDWIKEAVEKNPDIPEEKVA